ncbi:MAG: hypothetical protein ACOC6B_07275, partial [Thermodesulfobacteriota bacterium]
EDKVSIGKRKMIGDRRQETGGGEWKVGMGNGGKHERCKKLKAHYSITPTRELVNTSRHGRR